MGYRGALAQGRSDSDKKRQDLHNCFSRQGVEGYRMIPSPTLLWVTLQSQRRDMLYSQVMQVCQTGPASKTGLSPSFSSRIARCHLVGRRSLHHHVHAQSPIVVLPVDMVQV